MLGRLDLVTLVVNDVPLCAAFYREVLGFRPQGKFSANYLEFENQGVRFHLMSRGMLTSHVGDPALGDAGSGNGLELAIRVEDKREVERVYRLAVESGAPALREPAMMPWGEYTAFTADPDGNVIALFATAG